MLKKSDYFKIVLEYGKDIINNEKYLQQKKFYQHGTTSVYEHCIKVAMTAVKIAMKTNAKVNMRSLVRGALLHDFFLYDWHISDKSHRLHGFTHPYVACRNAEKEFLLNNIERDIIKRHMFPLTPVPPRYKESWIVTAADKLSASYETVEIFLRKYKKVK